MPTEDSRMQATRDWLEKQGYPLEMLVAQAFSNAGASVTQSAYYVDNETQKPREIDVAATWAIRTENHNDVPGELELHFLIECKSNQDGPWIIFTDGKRAEYLNVSPPCTSNGWHLLHLIDQSIDFMSLLWTAGYSVTQAFSTKQDIPYQAMMSTMKAAHDRKAHLQQFDDYVEKLNNLKDATIFGGITIPIVVTHAPLYACYLDELNQPTLDEIECGALDWKYPSSGGKYDSNSLYIYRSSSLNRLIDQAVRIKNSFEAVLPIWSRQRLDLILANKKLRSPWRWMKRHRT